MRYFLDENGAYYVASSDIDLSETVQTGTDENGDPIMGLRWPDKQSHTAVTERPSVYHNYVDGSWVQGTVPAPTTDDVNAERARRLQAGVDITLSTSEVIALQGRDEDMRNLHGLCTAAQLRLAGGDTTHETTFRDRNNTDHTLTPSKVVELWSQGAAWVSSVYQASWTIKDAGTIPADYASDSRWP